MRYESKPNMRNKELCKWLARSEILGGDIQAAWGDQRRRRDNYAEWTEVEYGEETGRREGH